MLDARDWITPGKYHSDISRYTNTRAKISKGGVSRRISRGASRGWEHAHTTSSLYTPAFGTRNSRDSPDSGAGIRNLSTKTLSPAEEHTFPWKFRIFWYQKRIFWQRPTATPPLLSLTTSRRPASRLYPQRCHNFRIPSQDHLASSLETSSGNSAFCWRNPGNSNLS